MALYHAGIYMPKYAYTPKLPFRFLTSQHAVQAAQEDRYGKIELPQDVFNPEDFQLFEIETDNRGDTVKLAYCALQGTYKIALVFKRRSRGETWKLVTAWKNQANDEHESLDIYRYAWH